MATFPSSGQIVVALGRVFESQSGIRPKELQAEFCRRNFSGHRAEFFGCPLFHGVASQSIWRTNVLCFAVPALSLTPRFSGVIHRPGANETVFNGFTLLMPVQPVSFHQPPHFFHKAALTVRLLLLGDVPGAGIRTP
jgi:hypothetical protein